MRSERGFTLMELLVVVAIIALLVGLTVVSMRTVRASASRSRSLGALRQIAMGYTQYTDDAGGRLLPGYIDATLFEPGEVFESLVVKQPSGTRLAEPDRQSYVWRLAPYMDNAWQTFFADTADVSALTRFNADFGTDIFGPADPTAAFGGISERPSFGMNSIFVGGDSGHGGPGITNYHPWQDGVEKVAATRLSEVMNPSRLIVFGPSALTLGTSAPQEYEDPGVGFCELRPPYIYRMGDTWILAQWRVGKNGLVCVTCRCWLEGGAGLPIDRSGKDRLPLVHLDGSTVVEQFSALSRDMRRWNPFEVVQRETAAPEPEP